MISSYVVSVYAVSSVPRDRRLEHFFVAAGSAQEAMDLARAIFCGHPDFGRYQVDLVQASELPLAAGHALPPPEGSGPGLTRGRPPDR